MRIIVLVALLSLLLAGCIGIGPPPAQTGSAGAPDSQAPAAASSSGGAGLNQAEASHGTADDFGADDEIGSGAAAVVREVNAGPLDSVPTSVVHVSEFPNVYHEAFRRPNLTAHPSTYIPGYPEDSRPLNLTLNASSYEEAVALDQAVWDSTEAQVLYYVPGTNFVGLFQLTGTGFAIDPADAHATGVASNLGGRQFGGNADVGIMVTFDGLDSHAAAFAEERLWIDFSSRSDSGWFPMVPGMYGDSGTYRMAQRGGITFKGAPNADANIVLPLSCGPVPTTVPCVPDGAPWSVQTGRLDDVDGALRGKGPLDASSSYGPCAMVESLQAYDDGCKGTSFATPHLAGLASRILDDVRKVWGYERCEVPLLACAPEGGVVPLTGPLSDGGLDRGDLLDALYQTALTWERHEFGLHADYFGNYTDQGWGLVTEATVEDAIEVLWGRAVASERPNIEHWWKFHQELRHAYWDHWPPIWEVKREVCNEYVPGVTCY